MGECEICGATTNTLYQIEIENAQMLACARCAKGKDVIYTLGPEREEVKQENRKQQAEEELVEDYGARIRQARDAMGIPLKVLGERINEKESTLFRVEQQRTLPTMVLTKKLERELGIKLTTKVEAEGPKLKTNRNQEITLGDAAFRKDDKK